MGFIGGIIVICLVGVAGFFIVDMIRLENRAAETWKRIADRETRIGEAIVMGIANHYKEHGFPKRGSK